MNARPLPRLPCICCISAALLVVAGSTPVAAGAPGAEGARAHVGAATTAAKQARPRKPSPKKAKRKKTSPFKVLKPKSGVVPQRRIAVAARLDVKRSLRVKRARFYIGSRRVTTDRRWPFKIKRGVRYDARKLKGSRTLKLTVRYEYRTRHGKLVRKKLTKRISLRSGAGVTGQGAPDADPNAPLPYDPALLPPCPTGMLVCEEFDGSELDRRLWSDHRRTGPGEDAGNYPWYAWNAWLEGAHYSPDNVNVADGILTMHVTDVPSGYDPYYPQHQRPKTTGSINTDGKFSFKYGTMEARIKVDACRLCWQSFWLHNQIGGHRPEFDVMEFMQWAGVGTSPYTVLHGLVGQVAENGVQYGNYEDTLAGAEADLTGDWHTYRITRTPTRMTITIDDDPATSCTTDDANVVTDNHMFVILSMAIADPEKAPGVGITSPVPVPAGSKMQVDWVRVWAPGHGPAPSADRVCTPYQLR